MPIPGQPERCTFAICSPTQLGWARWYCRSRATFDPTSGRHAAANTIFQGQSAQGEQGEEMRHQETSTGQVNNGS